MRKRLATFGYPLALIAALAAVLAAIEFRRPYYFLQDDNRDQALPFLVHNARALRGGELAQFDFHIFAGAPHLANGNSMVLYAPGYAATLLSSLLLGHPFGAIDLLTAFHLILGALGMFFLLRRITGDPRPAFWGAATFQLCS